MCAKEVTLEIDDETYPGRLNVPNGPSDQGVLMIPGAGHGPFGDVFLRFARTAAEEGFYVARFETWMSQNDLDEKTDADFETEITLGVEFLQSHGCSTITVVAKSFGGRLALEHVPDAVDRLVLWAPAVVLAEEEDQLSIPDEVDLPSISAAELAEIDVPVRILQGDEDYGLPVENARKMAEELPQGDFVVLPGEDHSFLTDHNRVIEETIAFLPGCHRRRRRGQ